MQTTNIATRYGITRHNVDREGGWSETITVDSPTISTTAAASLRNRVNDRRDAATDPVRWYAGDSGAWAAVTDLHRRGQHDHAQGLAALLYWTEQRATARDLVVWTLIESGR